jgi:hypothetical protein
MTQAVKEEPDEVARRAGGIGVPFCPSCVWVWEMLFPQLDRTAWRRRSTTRQERLGHSFGMSFCGTTSGAACTVGGKGFGRQIGFGFSRRRWALVVGNGLILLSPFAGGRSGEAARPPASRQLPSGRWTSKLDRAEDIEHDPPHDVAGGIYGDIVQIMKRPVSSPEPVVP